MAIRIHTVARTTLSAVTPELLRDAIASRLPTIAARFPASDEDTAAQVLAQLRVEAEGSGFEEWSITYAPTSRPIGLQRLVGKTWENDRRALFDEATSLEDAELGKRLRSLLTEAREGVVFELSDRDSHGIALSVAISAAAALAKASDGLLRVDGEGWFEVQGKDLAVVLSLK